MSLSDVGDIGVEPMTSTMSTWRANQLRQSPNILIKLQTLNLPKNRYDFKVFCCIWTQKATINHPFV